MTVHDFATVLEDSSVLVEVAADAGITPTQARRFCALMGERPAEQIIRILGSAKKAAKAARDREFLLGMKKSRHRG